MKHFSILLCWLAFALTAAASPGAHGPNGEHLDGPAATAGTGGAPRVETFTEDFELVAQLAGGELSVLIDRYASNEPVLNGRLEVQYKDMKAQAKFHSDIGDYAFDDARLVQALATPGKHQLLFTFVAGDESDLLEGTLNVPQPAGHDHDSMPRWTYWLPAAVLVLFVGGLLLRRRLATSTR